MDITTKFNHGDRVWVMKDNRPYQFKIYRIEIEVLEWESIREKYVDRIPGATNLDKDRDYFYWSHECFHSKRELLESFFTDEDK